MNTLLRKAGIAFAILAVCGIFICPAFAEPRPLRTTNWKPGQYDYLENPIWKSDQVWNSGADDLRWDKSSGMLHFEDNVILGFGNTVAAPDIYMRWDETNFDILPSVDDAAIFIGNGTLDFDITWYSGATANVLLFDASGQLVQSDKIDYTFGETILTVEFTDGVADSFDGTTSAGVTIWNLDLDATDIYEIGDDVNEVGPGTVGLALNFHGGVGSVADGAAINGAAGGSVIYKGGIGGAAFTIAAQDDDAGAGGAASLLGGIGGATTADTGDAGTAGVGGVTSVTGGVGGASLNDTADGGAGGGINIAAGLGGVGNTGTNSGAGGALSLLGGAAGAAGGGTQGVGGSVNIDSGAGVTNGTIGIGTSNALSTTIGNNTAHTTTITGTAINVGGSDIYQVMKTVVKTISMDDDASTDDFQFDDDAANQTEQPVDFGALIPAYAEIVAVQIRCFEAVTGGTMSIDIGVTTGAGDILGAVACDALNEVFGGAAASAPIIGVTNAARNVWVNATPSANWNTLTTGRYTVMVTYLDIGAVHTLNGP